MVAITAGHGGGVLDGGFEDEGNNQPHLCGFCVHFSLFHLDAL
jgi:hypothetical protein